jgi:hypothetical protein
MSWKGDLHKAGIDANGSTLTISAVPVYINMLVDDADHDVTSTPTNLILNGTITVLWTSMGDN